MGLDQQGFRDGFNGPYISGWARAVAGEGRGQVKAGQESGIRHLESFSLGIKERRPMPRIPGLNVSKYAQSRTSSENAPAPRNAAKMR